MLITNLVGRTATISLRPSNSTNSNDNEQLRCEIVAVHVTANTSIGLLCIGLVIDGEHKGELRSASLRDIKIEDTPHPSCCHKFIVKVDRWVQPMTTTPITEYYAITEEQVIGLVQAAPTRRLDYLMDKCTKCDQPPDVDITLDSDGNLR